jgi:ADP-heptose:LPS heptosyltransferase
MNRTLWLQQALKYLNKRRLYNQRLFALKLTDRASKEVYAAPDKPKRVLLISADDHFGNALFTLGLSKQLFLQGVSVYLAAMPELVKIFSGQSYIKQFYNLSQDESIRDLSVKKFDAVIDLEYVHAKFWKYRLQALKRIHAYSITTSELCSHLNFYNKYISYTDCAHVSARLAKIYNFLRFDRVDAIFPYLELSQDDMQWADQFLPDKKIIYLNCRAGDLDRWFSIAQAKEILEAVVPFRNCFIVFNPPKNYPTDNLPPNVKILDKVSFFQLAALVRRSAFVITPDTSVTHLASIYNIPTFVVFPPNDRDFYHNFAASEVWGALADSSVTLNTDDPDLIVDPYNFGYPNRKTRPVSAIDIEKILNPLVEFLHKILY